MFLLESIYFFVIIILVFYLPGRFLLSLVKYDHGDPLINIPLSTILGLSFFLLATFALSWLRLGFIYNLILLPIIILQLKREIIHRNLGNIKANLPEIAMVLVGAITMTYITALSGLPTEKGLIFYGINARDGIYHLALISTMVNNFPPVHPELAGLPLKGYHFFYDFLISEFSSFYHINVLDLFFRYFSFLTALLYGLSVLALARFLKMTKFSVIIFVFLAYFGGGLEFIFRNIWKDAVYNPGINPFLSNLINPSVLLSVSILFMVFITLFGKKRSLIIPALLLGVMPQIKIYTAILAFGSLGLVGLIGMLRSRDFYYLKVLAIASVIGGLIFIPFNLKTGGLIFTPFLLYRHFMETFSFEWGTHIMLFEQYHNFPRLFLLYSQGILAFLVPTLGIKLFSLLYAKKALSRNFYTQKNLFWIAIISGGFFLASFFIQSTDVFNIVQFMWFAYIVLLIPLVIALSDFSSRFKRTFIVKIIIILIVVGVSIPPSIDVLKSNSSNPYYIGSDEQKIAKYVKENVSLNDGLMVLNVSRGGIIHDLPEIAALSGHPTYYESTITSFKDTDAEKNRRIKLVESTSSLVMLCVGDVNNTLKDTMKKTQNKYILTLGKAGCFDTFKDFTEVKTFGNYHLYSMK